MKMVVKASAMDNNSPCQTQLTDVQISSRFINIIIIMMMMMMMMMIIIIIISLRY